MMVSTALRHRTRWLALIVVAVVAAAALGGSSPHIALTATSSTEFGDAYGAVSLATETSQFGHQPVVRVYNSGLPQAWPGNGGANNSDVVVSFKALPSAILSGADDATLTNWFKTAPTNHVVWWTYYHEPEDNIAAGTFTSVDYRAAWVHLVGLAAKANNPSLRATLILMSWTLNPASHRNFYDYYPGASVINTLGWDGYPSASSQTPPAQFMGASVALSKSLGKPFGFAEFGSTNPAGRGPWLTSVGAYLRSNGAVFGTYFNATTGGNFVLNDATSIAAWKAVIQTSGSPPPPTIPPTTPPTATPRPSGTPGPTAPPTTTPGPSGLTISGVSASSVTPGGKGVIRFTLSAAAHVTVTIATSSGTTVRNKVVDQPTTAGATSVDYAGYNDANAPLPSGTYVVVIAAANSAGDLVVATTSIAIAM